MERPEEMTDLNTALEAATAGTPGDFAWHIEDPSTGNVWTREAREAHPGASTLKLAVLLRLLQLVDDGRVGLDHQIRMRRWHQVGGAGVLQYFSPETTLSVCDVATLMVILSDNTATNMIIDLTGLGAVNNLVASLPGATGLTTIHRYYGKTSMAVPEGAHYTAMATANDLATIFREVLARNLLGPGGRHAFWQILLRQQDRALAPRHFGPDILIAHKTGAIDGVRNDAGVFWIPDPTVAKGQEVYDPMAIANLADPPGRPIIFVALSRNLGDLRWTVENAGEAAIGRLASATLEYFRHLHQ